MSAAALCSVCRSAGREQRGEGLTIP
jgi:hypothetical protein